MMSDAGVWVKLEDAGSSAPGAAVIGDATGAVTKSSFTGDGTNGDLGQAYDVYEFLGSGQLVVDEPGLAEILLCAGGGGGGTQDAGGGGAGGRLETAITFSKGTETVTVGAGGTATTFPNPGNNGQLSSLSFVSVVGGGKGGN